MDRSLTLADVVNFLDYDPDTGLFTNKVTRNSKAVAGERAGYANKALGCYQIKIRSKLYYAHRLAWLFVYGKWPEMDIDHVNGDALDNRIVNLRLATHKQNLRNTKRPAHNTSGYKGVTWNKKDKRWVSQIKTGGKTYRIGGFRNKEDAAHAYNAAAQRMFGEFARLNEV